MSSQVSNLKVSQSEDLIGTFWEHARAIPNTSAKFESRFDESRFLDRYVSLYHRMNMGSTLNRLISADIEPVHKADILTLLCHYETFSCPSPSDLRNLRENLMRIETVKVPPATVIELTQVLLFLQHPIIDGLLSQDSRLADESLDKPEWPKKSSLKQIGVPLGHLRDLIMHDLKSRTLSSSVAYRLSVFKPYLRCDKAVEFIEKALGCYTPSPLLTRINNSFRTFHFPHS